MQLHQVSLLGRCQLRRSAFKPALRRGDAQPLTGALPDQVRLELGDHPKDVEQWGSAFFGWLTATGTALFVAYYCGGYVAGRMARFAGVKQGIAVWIWAVVIAVVVAIVAAIAGSQFNILGQLNSFPRIPIDEGTLTVTGIVTVVIVAVISLLGAILGGLGGMRYHRKVDRVGLGR